MNLELSLSDCASAIRQWIAEAIPTDGRPDEAQFDHHARQLFAAQLRHNLPYRLLCERLRRTPATIRHWTEIPALPAATFKEFEVTCLPLPERTNVFHSSGTTTSQPSRHFHSSTSLRIYEASALQWFQAHVPGLAEARPDGAGLRCLCLTPSPALAPHSSLVHMFETFRQHLHFSRFDYVGTINQERAWTLDFVSLAELLAFPAAEPVIVLGTAFSFVHLGDWLTEQRRPLSLPNGSMALETGGYKGRSRVLSRRELHQVIQSTLGIAQDRIICEYGMSELSSQAYDRLVSPAVGALTAPSHSPSRHASERVFHFPAWARARVISPETGEEANDGETGLLRIYDLANAYSVLALQTEDLAVRRGNGFELIGRVDGAENRGCSLLTVPSLFA